MTLDECKLLLTYAECEILLQSVERNPDELKLGWDEFIAMTVDNKHFIES